ncbi:hypothetical protein ACFQX6_67600 [Streptosporangium lutulentum]
MSAIVWHALPTATDLIVDITRLYTKGIGDVDIEQIIDVEGGILYDYNAEDDTLPDYRDPAGRTWRQARLGAELRLQEYVGINGPTGWPRIQGQVEVRRIPLAAITSVIDDDQPPF